MSDWQGVRVVRYQTGEMSDGHDVRVVYWQDVRVVRCQTGMMSDWEDVRVSDQQGLARYGNGKMSGWQYVR